MARGYLQLVLQLCTLHSLHHMLLEPLCYMCAGGLISELHIGSTYCHLSTDSTYLQGGFEAIEQRLNRDDLTLDVVHNLLKYATVCSASGAVSPSPPLLVLLLYSLSCIYSCICTIDALSTLTFS
jgi:hypothetical protein